MKMNMIQTATITKESVLQLIKEAVERDTGKKVDRVELNVTSRCVGYGMVERTETVCTGATIHFSNEPSRTGARSARRH